MTDPLLSSTEALNLIHQRLPNSTLDRVTFGMYLTYDILDSVLVGNKRKIRLSALEAFLDLFPTGVYANHVDYIVKSKLGPDDLSPGEAYRYYASRESNPTTRGGFQSLAKMGIFPSIRVENKPYSAIMGFRKKDIDAFVSLRQRLGKSPSSHSAPPESEWISFSEAYLYYQQHVTDPKSLWWFRQQARKGLFETKQTGTTSKISRKSLLAYLESNASTVATATSLALPLEKAYFKFKDLIPDQVSLIGFQKLVRSGSIASITRDGIQRVTREQVSHFFGQLIEAHKQTPLPLIKAYAYYCQNTTRPVSRSQFTRWLGNGTLLGSKNGTQWEVTEEAIDSFLIAHLSKRDLQQEAFAYAKAQIETALGIKS
jgi:hypothetical protein